MFYYAEEHHTRFVLWLSKRVRSRIFFFGDLQEKEVSREIKDEIRKTKMKYRNKIESQYCSGDLKTAWRGIKSTVSMNQSIGEAMDFM